MVIFIFTQCNTSSKIKSINNNFTVRIDSLQRVINKIESKYPDKEFIDKSNLNAMYEFLIFEDDIDKGRLSISDVKISMDKSTLNNK